MRLVHRDVHQLPRLRCWLRPVPDVHVPRQLPHRLLCLLWGVPALQRRLHRVLWQRQHGVLGLFLGQLPFGRNHVRLQLPRRHLHQRVHVRNLRHRLLGLQRRC